MKRFWALIQKESLHIIRDKRSLLILLAQPVMMMLIFGFALTNEVKDSKTAILDLAHDETSRLLIDRIDQSHYFSVTRSLSNFDQISEVFRSGEARLVIVFPANFKSDLAHLNQAQVQIITDASDPNTANIAAGYASGIIRDYQMELLNQRALPLQIDVETRMLYNPQLRSAFNFVPGVMTLILMLLGAMMTSVSIVREKEMGTMEILLVSPMRPIFVVISKAVPYMLLGFIDLLLILGMAVFILDVPVRGSLPLLLAESLLFISTTLALGLLISSLAQQQQVAMFISLVGLLMPALVFSGYMFPIENMPRPMQIISNIVPTRWYYNIVRAVMVKGLGLEAIWRETLVLASMTTVLLGLAIRNFKERLE